MKKTLAAVAVLGAFAGSALAADVTLYGRVNLGLNYVHADDGSTTSDSWSLNSGDATGSRFGLKGSEQISEGLTVGFQLEHGFNADDGSDSSSKAFHRESRLYVATDYGTLHLGRFGALDSGTGSLDIVGGLTAAGTGYGDIIADQSRVFKTYSRLDNSIAYVSPEFAGVKVSAMVSLGGGASKDLRKFTVTPDGVSFGDLGEGEASSDVDRYYALGVSGQWGDLGAGLVVSQVDKGNDTYSASFAGNLTDLEKPELKGSVSHGDDGTNVTAGVNYDFGVAKAYLAGNYYKAGKVVGKSKSWNVDEDKWETKSTKTDISSWGVSTSVEAPLAAGTFVAAVGYGVTTDDAKAKDQDTEVLNVGAFYKYPLSKRTYVYAGAGYDQEKPDGKDTKKTYEVISGIAHQF